MDWLHCLPRFYLVKRHFSHICWHQAKNGAKKASDERLGTKMHDKPLDSQDYPTYNLTMIKIDLPIQLRNVTARYYWFTSPPA